jgi:signal transduction histidine kinase
MSQAHGNEARTSGVRDEQPVFGRLAVEQRILGLLALFGLLHVGWVVVWIALGLGAVGLDELLGPASSTVVFVVLAALLGNLVHVALRLPFVRWPRSDSGPSPLPLALAGAPSLLVWPLLLIRDRRARAQNHGFPRQEVELAFRELLALPRIAAISFGVWHGLATVTAVWLLVGEAGVDTATLGLTLAVALASLLPLVSVATSRIRSILVPEYVTAPRPEPLALPIHRSVVLRLGGPAGLALLGAVLVPTLVGALWARQLGVIEAREEAAHEAAALLRVAETGDEVALAAVLETKPGAAVVDGTRRLGVLPSHLPGPGASGPLDLDGDARVDHLVASSSGHAQLRVLVPLPPPAPAPILTWLAVIAIGLSTGLAALALLLRDVERDLGRASRQVTAVAEGRIPEPMAVETFATAELRGLVAAIDRLVGRITDANVHKYVLIEKGHEADRLKSQFLANMSHDLRSPLNSVLGFSELLTTGIEGELAPDQLEMVGTIHRTGKDLLQQIDDILDTAKIEAGRMELHREPTPPATLIARAIQRTRVRVTHPIEFDTVFAPGLPPAFADPYRTTQALENVLLFAAEGLQQGTIEISCEARREQGGGREIVIRIVSPRALVPLAELEQARRGFFRLPGHTGLGLGLPIATSILELQGGALLIEDGTSSSLGGRAAMGFELRLPALSARRGARIRLG